MTDLATHRWDRSTGIVLRDGVRREPATGRWMTTKGTKMTDDWQPMESAPRDGTVIEVLVNGCAWLAYWWQIGGDAGGNDPGVWLCGDDEDLDGWDDSGGERSPQPTAWRHVREIEQ